MQALRPSFNSETHMFIKSRASVAATKYADIDRTRFAWRSFAGTNKAQPPLLHRFVELSADGLVAPYQTRRTQRHDVGRGNAEDAVDRRGF
jgi:hypothetical protein